MPQLLREIYGPLYGPVATSTLHIILTIVLAYIILRLVDSALNRLRLLLPSTDLLGAPRVQQRTETLGLIIRSVVKGILIVFVTMQIGAELGFSIGPVLASAGIAGLAVVGFGAQSLVKDVISGFF